MKYVKLYDTISERINDVSNLPDHYITYTREDKEITAHSDISYKYGYIADGLTFMLDGINRGTNELNKWIDLIGGYVFQTVSGDATWGNNHLITPCTMSCTNYPIFSSNNPITLEVCCYPDTKTNSQMFISKSINGTSNRNSFHPAVGIYNNYWLLSNASSQKISISYDSAPIGKNYTFSITFNPKVIINGKQITTGTADYWYANATEARLGMLSGKIYSIRRYNRNLSTEEILHNQKVDQMRFFND